MERIFLITFFLTSCSQSPSVWTEKRVSNDKRIVYEAIDNKKIGLYFEISAKNEVNKISTFNNNSIENVIYESDKNVFTIYSNNNIEGHSEHVTYRNFKPLKYSYFINNEKYFEVNYDDDGFYKSHNGKSTFELDSAINDIKFGEKVPFQIGLMLPPYVDRELRFITLDSNKNVLAIDIIYIDGKLTSFEHEFNDKNAKFYSIAFLMGRQESGKMRSRERISKINWIN